MDVQTTGIAEKLQEWRILWNRFLSYKWYSNNVFWTELEEKQNCLKNYNSGMAWGLWTNPTHAFKKGLLSETIMGIAQYD